MDDQKAVGKKRKTRKKASINVNSDQKGDCGSNTESEHDQIHIWTERERRKKMRNMFSSLRDLLPLDKLPPKADKSSTIDEAVKYIKTLEYSLQALQKQRVNKLRDNAIAAKNFVGESDRETDFQTWFSPNVVVNMCGNDAQISVCSPRKPGILVTVFYILEKHNLDVVSAHICSDLCRSVLMIHAHASGSSEQLTQDLSVEDIFKLAAGEMNLWILSCQ